MNNELDRMWKASAVAQLTFQQILHTESMLKLYVCLQNKIITRMIIVTSVRIVTGYGLDDREIGVRFPVEAQRSDWL
jgi:hypothetical protein